MQKGKEKGMEEKKRPIDVLKESIGGVSRELLDRYKEQNRIVKMIRRALGPGPKTVPEVTEELKLPGDVVFWYIMAMRKYGEVVDAGESGDYVLYALKGEEESR